MKSLKFLISAIVLFLSVSTYGQTIVHKKKVKIQDSLIVNGNIKTTGTLNGTSATFSGDVSASNLSGTNTGDQDLSGYLLKTGGTLTGNLKIDQLAVAANPRLTFDHDNFGTSAYYIGANRSTDILEFIADGSASLTLSPSTATFAGNVEADKFITGQLEINSDLNATNIVSDDENLYIKSDHTSGNVRLIADAAIYVQTGSSEDLAITASSSSGVGLWHIGSKKIGTTTTGASVTGNLEVSGTILPETNNVQTITGTTSSATIGANINVVVVDTTVNCQVAATTQAGEKSALKHISA